MNAYRELRVRIPKDRTDAVRRERILDTIRRFALDTCRREHVPVECIDLTIKKPTRKVKS